MSLLAPHRTRYSHIGLDVQADSVAAVQLVRDEGRWKLHAAGTQAFEPAKESEDGAPPPALLALRKLLAYGAYSGSSVLATMPSKHVDIRPIMMPQAITPGTGPRFMEALRLEARSCLLYDPDEAVLDFLPLPKGQNPEEQDMLLIAARREPVNRQLALLKMSGLRCLHLDIRPCAALRALPKVKGAVAVVELERKATSVSLARDGALLFSRTFKTGWQHITDILGKGLDLSEGQAIEMLAEFGIADHAVGTVNLDAISESGVCSPEAIASVIYEICHRTCENIARELGRTIDYFSVQRKGGNVSQVYLFGQHAPRHLDTYLAERLRKPVQMVNPFQMLESGRARAGSSSYTVATGLALRALPL